jgi:hypothetical protein
MLAMKRYNLTLPETLYDALKAHADKRETTVVELFRRIVKLGLLALELEDNPNASIMLKEGDELTKIVLI